MCFGAGLPDGVLEVGADEVWMEKVPVAKIGKNLRSGDGGLGREVGKPSGNGMVRGLKKERAAFDPLIVAVSEFAVAVASPGGLGKGIKAAFRAIHDGKTNIHSGFDELSGD